MNQIFSVLALCPLILSKNVDSRILQTSSTNSSSSLPLYVFIIIAVVGVVLIAGAIIIAIYCIRKKRRLAAINNQGVTISIEIDQKKGENKNQKSFLILDGESKDATSLEVKSFQGIMDKNTSNLMDHPTISHKMTNRSKDEISILEKKAAKVDKAEFEFRKAIDKIDTKDDPIRDLIKNSPKHGKDMLEENNFKIQESKEAEKAVKDIVSQNIKNYTEGDRHSNNTEGSKNPYFDSVVSESADEYGIGNSVESENDKRDTHSKNKNEMFNEDNFSHVKESARELFVVSNKVKRTNDTKTVNKRVSSEMTPEEHSDFMDENDDQEESNKYETANYQSHLNRNRDIR